MARLCIYDGCGKCRHIRVGGETTPDKCAACAFRVDPANGVWGFRGAGDVVAAVARVTGAEAVVRKVVPNCRCNERREALNRAIPFGRADGPKGGTNGVDV